MALRLPFLRRGALASAGAACLYYYQRTSHALETPKLAAPQTQSIVLRDGRRLAFRAEGDGATPVFALHGMGSSHMTWISSEPRPPLTELGVQLIAVDRPGYGDSSPPPLCYSYSQFADDLTQLADALGIDKFCVAGHSSGGPYARGAAAVLGERVLSVASVAGDPPYAHPAAPAAVRESDFVYRRFGELGMYGIDPAAAFSKMRADALATGLPQKLHAWKSGVSGFVTDFQLERLPWSFRIEDISLGERCTIWVGERDNPATKLGAPLLARLVKGSKMRVVPGGEHNFVKAPEHLRAVLDELVSAAGRAGAPTVGQGSPSAEWAERIERLQAVIDDPKTTQQRRAMAAEALENVKQVLANSVVTLEAEKKTAKVEMAEGETEEEMDERLVVEGLVGR